MRPPRLNRANINRSLHRNNLFIRDKSEYVGMYQPRKNVHFAVEDTATNEVLGEFPTLREAYDFVTPIYEERNRQRIAKLEEEKPEFKYRNALLEIKSLASSASDSDSVMQEIVSVVDKALN